MSSNFKSVKTWQVALKNLGVCSILGIAMLGQANAAADKKSSPSPSPTTTTTSTASKSTSSPASKPTTTTASKTETKITKKADTTKPLAILVKVAPDDQEADGGGGTDLEELMDDQQTKKPSNVPHAKIRKTEKLASN